MSGRVSCGSLVLERELSDLDREIDDTVRGSPAWREKEDLLTSVPGIGAKTAYTLIAELPELGTLDRKPSPVWRAWRPTPANPAGGRARA